MRKNIIFGYIIFSIILFIALITIYSFKIKSKWDSNYTAVETSFDEFIIQASSLYSYRSNNLEYYNQNMINLYNQEERILLFVLYSKTSEGIKYLYTNNSDLLKNTNKDRINIGWQGRPEYTDLPLQRFGTEVLTMPLQILDTDLYAEAIYLILGKTDLIQFIIEILIVLGVFLIITFIIFALIPSKNDSKQTEPEKKNIRRRRIVEELDNPVAKESENTGAKNLFSPFTGLGFKEYFKKRLELELKRAESFEHDLSLIIVSIDRYVHLEDPSVIYNQIGKMLLEDFIHQELIFEYSDGNFILVLPAVKLEESINKMEYFKNKVAAARIYSQSVTLSAGLSSRNQRTVDSKTLIDETKSALDRAKDTGKNQLFAFKADPEKFEKILSE